MAPPRLCRALAAAALASAAGIPGVARADAQVAVEADEEAKTSKRGKLSFLVNPGLLCSFSGSERMSLGGEISAAKLFPFASGPWLGVGGVTQLEAVTKGKEPHGAGHLRFALGGQVNYTAVGLELGWAFMTASRDFAATHGLHVAPFLSLGIFSIASRFTIPIARAGELPIRPFYVSAVLTVKMPILFDPSPHAFWKRM
jgi:hypothetical protein